MKYFNNYLLINTRETRFFNFYQIEISPKNKFGKNIFKKQ